MLLNSSARIKMMLGWYGMYRIPQLRYQKRLLIVLLVYIHINEFSYHTLLKSDFSAVCGSAL